MRRRNSAGNESSASLTSRLNWSRLIADEHTRSVPISGCLFGQKRFNRLLQVSGQSVVDVAQVGDEPAEVQLQQPILYGIINGDINHSHVLDQHALRIVLPPAQNAVAGAV